MVPYDQPEAALVRTYHSFDCVKMLTCLDCPGYDHQMGGERSSDRLILCPVPYTYSVIPKYSPYSGSRMRFTA